MRLEVGRARVEQLSEAVRLLQVRAPLHVQLDRARVLRAGTHLGELLLAGGEVGGQLLGMRAQPADQRALRQPVREPRVAGRVERVRAEQIVALLLRRARLALGACGRNLEGGVLLLEQLRTRGGYSVDVAE